MDNKLQLIKLEEISLKPNLFCLITSKRGTGKSVFSKSLIYELCQSDTYEIELNSCYNKVIKKNNVFTSDKLESNMKKIIEYQRKNRKKDQYILIIIDDVDISKKNKGSLQLIATQGRHLHIGCISIVQYCKNFIDNIIRNNLDLIIIGIQNYTALECLYQCMFFKNNMSKKEFMQTVNKNTQNHHFIVYDTIEEKDKYQSNNELIQIKVDNIEISCQREQLKQNNKKQLQKQ